jgi:hypothetical protein
MAKAGHSDFAMTQGYIDLRARHSARRSCSRHG